MVIMAVICAIAMVMIRPYPCEECAHHEHTSIVFHTKFRIVTEPTVVQFLHPVAAVLGVFAQHDILIGSVPRARPWPRRPIVQFGILYTTHSAR